MIDWFVATLRQYPEIAIFLALALGYYFGGFSYRGVGLGAVTATLLAAVIIGQLGIPIAQPLKAFVFLMFLFAVGYGVGPQFVRGIAKDGVPQALFAVVVCLLCLGSCAVVAKIAGYDLGSAAGLFAGSQTISASMGLATDAINRLGLPPDQVKSMLDLMPVAYAVTYIFGTVGSGLLVALIGPPLLGVNLEKACKEYEAQLGDTTELGGAGSAWNRWALRAFAVKPGGAADGRSVAQAEDIASDNRVFILRIRRDGKILEGTADQVLRGGDIVAVAGSSDALIGIAGAGAKEVNDPELLSVPAGALDVLVTRKEIDGKTIGELAEGPGARGVFLAKITRGATATSIPITPNTKVERGDILSIVGRSQDTTAVANDIGVADRVTDVADVAFIGAAIFIGAMVGALVWKVGGVPLTLSTAGGALISGLVFGWLRSVRPSFGRIPSPTVWFMNSFGLNVFIAIVGISSGPGFVKGLQTLGVSLFLWGIVATSVPLILSLFIGKYIFKFHPAILFGAVSGARTTTASLGMVCEIGKSQVPALGYTVTYAVGNTLLTIWGMVIILILQ